MNGRLRTLLGASRPALSREALEARVALRIAGALSQRSDAIPHDIAERLRVARLRAVDRARELRKLSAAPAHQALRVEADRARQFGVPAQGRAAYGGAHLSGVKHVAWNVSNGSRNVPSGQSLN